MIVLDASVTIDVLLDIEPYAERAAARIDAEPGGLHAPHLIDAEVGQVLRRYVLAGVVEPARAKLALERLKELRLIRYPHLPFLARAFDLRRNFTVYDGLYVALAEMLESSLLTRDGRLARSAGRLIDVIHIR